MRLKECDNLTIYNFHPAECFGLRQKRLNKIQVENEFADLEKGEKMFMRKSTMYLSLLLLMLPHSVANNDAVAGYCPGMKGGKCPTQKKITRSRTDFTAAQRAKMMEEARQICKKKYGSASTVYKLDYFKWRVICNER